MLVGWLAKTLTFTPTVLKVISQPSFCPTLLAGIELLIQANAFTLAISVVIVIIQHSDSLKNGFVWGIQEAYSILKVATGTALGAWLYDKWKKRRTAVDQ